MKRSFISSPSATALVLCVISVGAVRAFDDTVRKTFDVSPGGTLTVDTCIGSIDVTSGPSDEATIEIKRLSNTLSEREAKRLFDEFIIRFEQRGNNVFVFVEHEDQATFFKRMGNWRLNLRLTAVVPKQFNTDLKTSGGSISVADLSGRVDAETSGGSLSFGTIDGPVIGRTSGGSITLAGCRGPADIKTSGGSISIGKVTGHVEAHTSGGGITVEEVLGTINAATSGGSITAKMSAQPDADCKLTTSGGSITLYAAKGLKFSIDAKTSGGRVTVDFPVTVQGELSPSRLQADVNGGGPNLYLRTFGGSIHLKQW